MREGVGGGKLVEGAEESNPFIRLLDECRSMATLWALAERTLRAYCLVSTASPTTSESIYLRTFKAPADERPPLKDTANWLRIDLQRFSPFPFPRASPRFVLQMEISILRC